MEQCSRECRKGLVEFGGYIDKRKDNPRNPDEPEAVDLNRRKPIRDILAES